MRKFVAAIRLVQNWEFAAGDRLIFFRDWLHNLMQGEAWRGRRRRASCANSNPYIPPGITTLGVPTP